MTVAELIAKLEALPDGNVEAVILDTEYGICPLAVSVSESQEPRIILQIDEAAYQEQIKIAEKLCR